MPNTHGIDIDRTFRSYLSIQHRYLHGIKQKDENVAMWQIYTDDKGIRSHKNKC